MQFLAVPISVLVLTWSVYFCRMLAQRLLGRYWDFRFVRHSAYTAISGNIALLSCSTYGSGIMWAEWLWARISQHPQSYLESNELLGNLAGLTAAQWYFEHICALVFLPAFLVALLSYWWERRRVARTLEI